MSVRLVFALLATLAVAPWHLARAAEPVPAASSAPDVNASLDRGTALLKKRDYRGAETAFTAALAREPQNVEALRGRGHARYFIGDEDGAIADMSAVLAIDPNDARAHFYRARAYHRKHQLQPALDDITAAIAADPRMEPAYALRGSWLLQADVRSVPARADLRKAIALDPGDWVPRSALSFALYEDKQFGEAIAQANAVLAKQPDDDRALIARAGSEFALNESRAAARDYTTYLKRNSDDVSTRALRGVVRYYLDDYSGAIADLAPAIKANVAMPFERRLAAAAYTFRAMDEADRGDYAAATRDCDTALAAADVWPVYFIRGELRALHHDFAGARSDLAHLTNIEPAHRDVPYLLTAAIDVFEGQRAAAFAAMNHAIALSPSAANYAMRALMRNNYCDPRGAVADASAALHINAKDGTAWAMRAEARAATGDLRGAVDDASQSLRMWPDYAPAWAMRGVYERRLGRNDDAIADYTRAIALRPNYADAYVDRALARARVASDLEPNAFAVATASPGADPTSSVTLGSALMILAAHVPSPGALLKQLRLGTPVEAATGRDAGTRARAAMAAALADVRSAERYDARDAYAFRIEGLLLARQHRYTDAAGAFAHALALAPNDGHTFVLRGTAYSYANRHAEALADFQRAVDSARRPPQRDPAACAATTADPSDAYDSLGNELRIQGRYDAARSALTTAIRINPGNADAWYHRGEAYKQLGDRAHATADLQHAAVLYDRQHARDDADRARSELHGLDT